MKKDFILLSMYDKFCQGKPIRVDSCCLEYGISIPTFHRYLAVLRFYFAEAYAKEIVYDCLGKKYLLKNAKT